MKLDTFLFFDPEFHRIVNVIGPQGSGKSVFVYNVIVNVLHKKQKIMLMLFDEKPITVIDRIHKMSRLELYQIHDDLIIVDGYSQITGVTSSEKYSVNSRDLSDISIGLSKALQNKPDIVIIDPFSSLSIHHQEQSFIMTFQIILAKLR